MLNPKPLFVLLLALHMSLNLSFNVNETAQLRRDHLSQNVLKSLLGIIMTDLLGS